MRSVSYLPLITPYGGPLFVNKENLKKTHLKKEYDDQKDAIGSEEDAGLFEGATVAEDGDDQDEGANCN